MYIKTEPNEYGTDTSHHICDACKREFTITPANKHENFCLADDCESYDPHRDIEVLFMSNKEIAQEKKVVSIELLRKRKNKNVVL